MRAVRASLLARAGSAAAVAVLAAGGVLAAAGAASAAVGHAKLPTTLHVSNKVVARNHHRADALTGVLRSDRKALAAEKVTLEGRAGVHRKWVVITTGTTGANGTVTLTVPLPTKFAQFEMVFAGDSKYRQSHSNVVLTKK